MRGRTPTSLVMLAPAEIRFAVAPSLQSLDIRSLAIPSHLWAALDLEWHTAPVLQAAWCAPSGPVAGSNNISRLTVPAILATAPPYTRTAREAHASRGSSASRHPLGAGKPCHVVVETLEALSYV